MRGVKIGAKSCLRVSGKQKDVNLYQHFAGFVKATTEVVNALTEILRNSAFWTYDRQYGSFEETSGLMRTSRRIGDDKRLFWSLSSGWLATRKQSGRIGQNFASRFPQNGFPLTSGGHLGLKRTPKRSLKESPSPEKFENRPLGPTSFPSCRKAGDVQASQMRKWTTITSKQGGDARALAGWQRVEEGST